MLKLRSVEYLYEQQWHWELNKCDDSDTEKRSEIYNVYKYKWDIHSVYNRATESDHNDEYNKCSENDEIKALNSKYIYR